MPEPSFDAHSSYDHSTVTTIQTAEGGSWTAVSAGAILQELCSYGLAMLATDSNATWCLQQLVSDLRSPQEVTAPPLCLSVLWWLCFFSGFQSGALFGCCLLVAGGMCEVASSACDGFGRVSHKTHTPWRWLGGR
eukprot:COSAG04_NODE_788_length_10303_cov_33.536946_2_plen_135_part_00